MWWVRASSSEATPLSATRVRAMAIGDSSSEAADTESRCGDCCTRRDHPGPIEHGEQVPGGLGSGFRQSAFRPSFGRSSARKPASSSWCSSPPQPSCWRMDFSPSGSLNTAEPLCPRRSLTTLMRARRNPMSSSSFASTSGCSFWRLAGYSGSSYSRRDDELG